MSKKFFISRSCCHGLSCSVPVLVFFFFQAEDGIRDLTVTGVQTCALPISTAKWENIAIVKAVQAAVCPLNTRNGATGMNAPIAVDAPVSHPSLKGVA